MFEIGLILFVVVAVIVIAIDAWDDHKWENMK